MAPRTNPRHEPERVYERAADPAEAVNRPLESKTLPAQLADAESRRHDDEPPDPHHRLNTPVGEPDPAADSDPYRPSTPDDEADRASGTTGSNAGAEGRG
jgi:hypothetical protein